MASLSAQRTQTPLLDDNAVNSSADLGLSASSAGAASAREAWDRTVAEAKMLLSDRSFCLLLAGFGIGLGLANAIMTMVRLVSGSRNNVQTA